MFGAPCGLVSCSVESPFATVKARTKIAFEKSDGVVRVGVPSLDALSERFSVRDMEQMYAGLTSNLKSKADQEKMGVALSKLAAEDPSFSVRTDEESGQTIIGGMGELHLDIIVDRMRREFSVSANIGKPQVAYRETIRASVEVEGKFVRQSGGRGQYGHVWLKLEPLHGDQDYEFVDEIVGGAVPREYINAVNKGIQEQLRNGVLAGYPLEALFLYDANPVFETPGGSRFVDAFECQAVYQFFNAKSFGDDIALYDQLNGEVARFRFPRDKKRNFCISDRISSSLNNNN